MVILGLNAFHADSSAALLLDGKLIAAAEEERFRRIKHWAGFPSQAIAYCLRESGVGLSDVDHIAFNQDNHANLMRKICYFVIKRPNIDLVSRLRNRRVRRAKARSSGRDCSAERSPPMRCGSSFIRSPTTSAISCARWRRRSRSRTGR